MYSGLTIIEYYYNEAPMVCGLAADKLLLLLLLSRVHEGGRVSNCPICCLLHVYVEYSGSFVSTSFCPVMRLAKSNIF